MVNNFPLISSLLVFDSEDDFYHLQILKRKKDNPGITSNSKMIKTYYIKSLEDLENKKEEIIMLCNFHNARACINLNRRSFEKIAFQFLRKVADQIMNRDHKACIKAYDSVCGANSNEKEKKWILDIDNKDFDESELLNIIENIAPQTEKSKFIAKIPTKNGYHLITNPFNVQQLRDASDFDDLKYNFDIQKDNPTILYVP